MKKNDILSGTCIDYTSEGDGIVKVNQFTFFIKGIIKNEEVEFIVTKIKKNYGYGKLQKIIKASQNRIDPICPYFPKCGGCQLQYMNDAEQAFFKENLVNNNLSKIGGLDIKCKPILSMDFKPYRNKAQFPVNKVNDDINMGFYRIHSNDIINIDNCLIQSEQINNVFKTIKNILPKYKFNTYLRHVLIKHALHSNEIMIVLIARKDRLDNIDNFIKEIVNIHGNIKSIILNINTSNNNVILGKEEKLLYGNKTICEHIHNLDFNIASKSFFQVNPYQSEVLYQKALDYADIKENDIVCDLYCGVGSITLCLASKAKFVYGVEIVEDAIINAKENAKLNNINNVEFICSDAKEYAQKIVNNKINIDVLVVDPPRKGLDEDTINNINIINPKRIVYVSCNVATLSRDLKQFKKLGYDIQEVTPVDMFPYTKHVESVALMMKNTKE